MKTKKILLVMSPMFRHDTHYITSKESEIPIGLCYIGAVLEKAGHMVRILDGQISPDIDKELSDLLTGENWDVLGISATTSASPNASRLIALIKKIKPSLPVIFGGVHATVTGSKVLEELPLVDIAVFNEGEITMLELIEYFDGKRNLESIEGIAFRKGKEIVQTNQRVFIKDLDTLPFPAYHLVDILKYTPPPGLFSRTPTIAISTSRGCVYQCNYCAHRVLWQNRCRMHSAEYVLSEMELLVKKFGIREIRFLDDTFTLNRERVVKICEELLKKNLDVLWRCASRADRVDSELLKLMKKSGCCSISFGIESGSEEILKKMNRTVTLEQIRQAVKWSKEAGIETKGFFLMNYPGDTIETTEQTIALSRELDLDFAGFNLIVPFKGTQVREEIKNNYKIEPRYWDDPTATIGNQIYFYQDGLPVDYLKKAYQRAMYGFYLKPKMLFKAMRNIYKPQVFMSFIKGFFRLFKIRVLE